MFPEAPEFVLSGTATIQPVGDGSTCLPGSGVEARVVPSSFSSGPTFPVLNEFALGHLLIADVPWLLYRSFFALPKSITDGQGRPVNALLGTVNAILSLIGSQLLPKLFPNGFTSFAAKDVDNLVQDENGQGTTDADPFFMMTDFTLGVVPK